MYGNFNPRIFDDLFVTVHALDRFPGLTRFSIFRCSSPVDAFGNWDVVSNRFSRSVTCFDWMLHISLQEKKNLINKWVKSSKKKKKNNNNSKWRTHEYARICWSKSVFVDFSVSKASLSDFNCFLYSCTVLHNEAHLVLSLSSFWSLHCICTLSFSSSCSSWHSTVKYSFYEIRDRFLQYIGTDFKRKNEKTNFGQH